MLVNYAPSILFDMKCLFWLHSCKNHTKFDFFRTRKMVPPLLYFQAPGTFKVLKLARYTLVCKKQDMQVEPNSNWTKLVIVFGTVNRKIVFYGICIELDIVDKCYCTLIFLRNANHPRNENFKSVAENVNRAHTQSRTSIQEVILYGSFLLSNKTQNRFKATFQFY